MSQARPSLSRSRSPNVVPPRVVPPRVEPPCVVPQVQSVASPALLSRTRVDRRQTVVVEDSDAEDYAAHNIEFGIMFNVS